MILGNIKKKRIIIIIGFKKLIGFKIKAVLKNNYQ